LQPRGKSTRGAEGEIKASERTKGGLGRLSVPGGKKRKKGGRKGHGIDFPVGFFERTKGTEGWWKKKKACGEGH